MVNVCDTHTRKSAKLRSRLFGGQFSGSINSVTRECKYNSVVCSINAALRYGAALTMLAKNI